MSPAVARHRTALSRTSLSRPVALALDDGLVATGTSFFDYGCGRGDDLRYLTALGYSCAGWDPVHNATGERTPADVVNLGYVVNVIENETERADTLRTAWQLAMRVLIVSARLTWDARDVRGRPLGDGILTATGTFQRFYAQEELRAWIEEVLGTKPVAAAPGIFYVFRDPSAAQGFLAERVTTRTALSKAWVSEALFERHQELLAPLLAFLAERARLPKPGELPEAERIRSEIGSLARAFALITHVTGPAQWETRRGERARDLLVYMALSRFARRPRFGELPDVLRYDVRDFFGTYRAGCAQADRLLFAAGNSDTVDLAACTSPVGKLTPSALYLHRDALHALPALLRVLEGCARTLSGEVAGTTLIKLSRDHPQVSYLACPDFDSDPHPALATAVTVNLRRLSVDFRDYRPSTNPPVLHRKEEFLAPDDARSERFARLTAQEERLGLYEEPERIGTRAGWLEMLHEHQVTLRGHRVVPATWGVSPQ